MSSMNQNTKVIKTIEEFDKLFYPKSIQKEALKKLQDSKVIGSELAKKSLRKIKYQINNK